MSIFKRSLHTLKPEKNPFVSADWLSKNLQNVVPVDATYYNIYQRSVIKESQHSPFKDFKNAIHWILRKEQNVTTTDYSTNAMVQFEMGHIPVIFCFLSH
jgi:hypothetical protein